MHGLEDFLQRPRVLDMIIRHRHQGQRGAGHLGGFAEAVLGLEVTLVLHLLLLEELAPPLVQVFLERVLEDKLALAVLALVRLPVPDVAAAQVLLQAGL